MHDIDDISTSIKYRRTTIPYLCRKRRQNHWWEESNPSSAHIDRYLGIYMCHRACEPLYCTRSKHWGIHRRARMDRWKIPLHSLCTPCMREQSNIPIPIIQYWIYTLSFDHIYHLIISEHMCAREDIFSHIPSKTLSLLQRRFTYDHHEPLIFQMPQIIMRIFPSYPPYHTKNHSYSY